ncbi:ATP-binding protein [Mycobacterium sp. TY813]|uniref:ATP-binding protein n=1 Tax=Mycobacterium TaxID=1763 RepID=UPI0027403C7E|nr:ATP-binding protein [Mycobacterium sp. TY813]
MHVARRSPTQPSTPAWNPPASAISVPGIPTRCWCYRNRVRSIWKRGAGPRWRPAPPTTPPGSLVLLYTDGLIERAGETLDRGFDRLKAAAVECADLPVESVCAELLHRMTPPGGYRDDVVVLAVRPRHAGSRSFATVVPATAKHVPAVRARLRDWLATTGLRRQDEILLAVSEAVTNAIEHGSGCEARKTVAIEAFLRRDAVSISVSDSGRWVGDSSASRRSRRRGRGLTLIRGLADQVETVRTTGGTRVTLRFASAS